MQVKKAETAVKRLVNKQEEAKKNNGKEVKEFIWSDTGVLMKNLYEVFAEFENAPNRQEKIDILRNNKSYALECVFKCDPEIS